MYVDLDLKTLQLFKKKYMRNYSTENILDDGKISAQSKMKKKAATDGFCLIDVRKR